MLPLLTFSTKLRFLKKRKLQRPTCCLDIWITFWGRYKYIFVKGKNPNISKSSIKVNLLLRIFKRNWKLKELPILTTSINPNICAQIFKEDSQSQTLLFFLQHQLKPIYCHGIFKQSSPTQRTFFLLFANRLLFF